MLALFLGMDYALTSLAIGAFFLIAGVVGLALPRRASPPRAVSVGFVRAASAPLAPTGTVKLECPNCGASPSHVGPHRLTNCEYCGASFLVPGA